MAFWSPPTSADPDLKQQLFDFKVRPSLLSHSLNFLKNYHHLLNHARKNGLFRD